MNFTPFLLVIIAFGTWAFAIKWKREETLQAASKPLLKELGREFERQSRRVLVLTTFAAIATVTTGVVAVKYRAEVAALIQLNIGGTPSGRGGPFGKGRQPGDPRPGTGGQLSRPSTVSQGTPAEEVSFSFTIYDMDNAGLSGDTLVLQGFLMPMGAIDTLFVADSVEIEVEGAEVAAYVEHRGISYSDGSARVIFTQFRADPSTETTGRLIYSGGSVDVARMTEVSWTTSDTTKAAINSGDSTGIRTGFNGYHPVMAFATDSAFLVDAYFYPLATLAEVQALTGNLSEAPDTIFQRLEDYSNMLWDSTTSARITGEVPSSAAYTDISILVDYTAFGCEDWTNSATNFNLYRKAAGQPNNFVCRSGHNYYDWAKTLQQHGIMRDADSTGVEFMRRSFAIDWQDLLYWPRPNCHHSEINRRPISTGMLGTYFFVGDSAYVDQIECLGERQATGARFDEIGDVDGDEGEPRVIAFTIDVIVANLIANTDAQDWAAKLDSVMERAVNGTTSDPAYVNGIWALDSLTSDPLSNCTGPYNDNARPQNSLMIPLLVQSLLRGKHIAAKDTFVIGTDTTDLVAVFQEVSDTMTFTTDMWIDSISRFRNYTNSADCSDPDSWDQIAQDIMGVHAITLYADYVFDGTAASLTEADSMLVLAAYNDVLTVSYDTFWDVSGVREYIVSEFFNTIPEAFGWRKVGGG